MFEGFKDWAFCNRISLTLRSGWFRKAEYTTLSPGVEGLIPCSFGWDIKVLSPYDHKSCWDIQLKQKQQTMLRGATQAYWASYMFICFRDDICEDVHCMTREEFLKKPESSFKEINSIVMDEVHHYRCDMNKGKPDWYSRAENIVSRESGSYNGYLWLFLDMFQKENKFKSGNFIIIIPFVFLHWTYCSCL